MYQSNQARIKKENPSLLPSRGQGPRPVSSHPRSPSRRHNIRRASQSELPHNNLVSEMPGQDEMLPVTSSPMTPDQLTAAITDLACSVADIQSYLADIQSYLGIPPLQPASWPLPQSVVASLPPVFPYGMPSYGTTTFSLQLPRFPSISWGCRPPPCRASSTHSQMESSIGAPASSRSKTRARSRSK